MSKFKGNKGEWKVGDKPHYIVSDVRPQRATYTEENWEYEKEHYGGYLIAESIPSPEDANLLAASKDLLEALQRMVKLYEKVQPAGGYQYYYDSARSAIKKALKGNEK